MFLCCVYLLTHMSAARTLHTCEPSLDAMHLHSKTRGMGAGRKLRVHRRNQRWADKDYKKSNLGSEWKKPFAGASHAKGIVLEKMYVGGVCCCCTT